MQYSFVLLLILFSINNLLHYVGEKVIIVIFILFVYVIMNFLNSIVASEFKSRLTVILNEVNNYMNVLFNFLYINKLFYLNLKQLILHVSATNMFMSHKFERLVIAKTWQ